MFKEIGQLAGMMRQLPKIKEEMDKLQQRLGQLSAEGDAGAGMVRIRVNGRMEVQACTLSDEALKSGDKEMLEDLIRAATNQALERIRRQVADETGKMASGFGLPPGVSIPGLSLPGGES
ncbi:MAG: YbaB/EbfC family nucleoid-associated protein [Gemmataceae bacterium]